MIDLINHLSCTPKGCEEMNVIDCPRRVKNVRVVSLSETRGVRIKRLTLSEHKKAWLTVKGV